MVAEWARWSGTGIADDSERGASLQQQNSPHWELGLIPLWEVTGTLLLWLGVGLSVEADTRVLALRKVAGVEGDTPYGA